MQFLFFFFFLLFLKGWCLPCLSNSSQEWHSWQKYCGDDVWWHCSQHTVSIKIYEIFHISLHIKLLLTKPLKKKPQGWLLIISKANQFVISRHCMTYYYHLLSKNKLLQSQWQLWLFCVDFWCCKFVTFITACFN